MWVAEAALAYVVVATVGGVAFVAVLFTIGKLTERKGTDE